MGTTTNKKTYEKIIAEDIEWLLAQPRTLERDHIEHVLRDSPTKKRVRHRFIGNADKQIDALDKGLPVPTYCEICARCGQVVHHVQTPKERRRYCPANH
jgi:hypothetical protein